MVRHNDAAFVAPLFLWKYATPPLNTVLGNIAYLKIVLYEWIKWNKKYLTVWAKDVNRGATYSN